MICKVDLRPALLALVLAAGGCADSASPTADGTAVTGDRALVRLLDEANAAMAAGALAEAGRKLDEARAIESENPDLWVGIARLRFRGGEHLTALEAADKALTLGPDHAASLLMRALMVRDVHGFVAARPWFEAAIAADPDNADAWAEYAATLGDGGEARAILDAVRRLADIAPADPRVFYLQAVLAARGGQYPLARSLLTRSGMAARRVPAAMLLDAAISLQVGNYESAVATLETLAARQPANARVNELLARALLLSGRADAIIDRFGADTPRAEMSPYLAMLVARAHERLGDRASAAPLLELAYAPLPTAPVVLADKAGLPLPTTEARKAGRAGNAAAMQASVRALQNRFPASADIASLAGDAALAADDPAGSLAAYARATRVKRPWPLTRKAVFAYDSAGDPEAAETLLARHVAGEPNGLAGLVQLAQQQEDSGEWPRAAALLDHAIAIGGGHDPALLALRVKVARALTKTDDVRRLGSLLAEVSPRPLATP